MTRSFPEGFRWGTATAAHQVEGGNWNNDWWAFEHADGTPCAEPSGDACDQYHRYADDIGMLAQLGFDNYRFSIEWSRIEPEEGEFSKAALDHYRRVCAACLAVGVDPVVTFHHFTSPRWVADDGGWANPAVVDRFARFCEVAGKALGDLVHRACTINEPNVTSFIGYIVGAFPPGVNDKDQWKAAAAHYREAHVRSFDVLKEVLGNDTPVGLTLSMSDYQAVPADDPGAIAKRDRIRGYSEDFFLDACEGNDFIGVQTYSRDRIGPDGQLGPEEGVEVLPMGYEYYPESLEATIRRAATYSGIPVLVTENGIGTDDDAQRQRYLRTALEGVLACIDDGIEVQGYTCWSLLDNFEWAFGYGPRFGIVDVDRSTQQRTVKPSGHWLGRVAKANALVD